MIPKRTQLPQMGITRLHLEFDPQPRPEALQLRYDAFRDHRS
jgi:hypothetical protein